MHRRAGPPIVDGIIHHARPNRVKLCVAQGSAEVRCVQGAGIIAALPHMPRRHVPGVEIRSVPPVCVLQGKRKRRRTLRHDDQVDVVGHEAIADQRESLDLAVGPEEVEVDQAVGIGFEDELAGIAALRDMMGRVGGENTGKTSHE